MVTTASFGYTIKCFHTHCWDLGGFGKSALVHYTVANRIFVAGARSRRGRWNDQLDRCVMSCSRPLLVLSLIHI